MQMMPPKVRRTRRRRSFVNWPFLPPVAPDIHVARAYLWPHVGIVLIWVGFEYTRWNHWARQYECVCHDLRLVMLGPVAVEISGRGGTARAAVAVVVGPLLWAARVVAGIPLRARVWAYRHKHGHQTKGSFHEH